jgi:hypothetical protein
MTDAPIYRNGNFLPDPVAQTLPWRPSSRDKAEIIIADSMLGAVICAIFYISFRAMLLFS